MAAAASSSGGESKKRSRSGSSEMSSDAPTINDIHHQHQHHAHHAYEPTTTTTTQHHHHNHHQFHSTDDDAATGAATVAGVPSTTMYKRAKLDNRAPGGEEDDLYVPGEEDSSAQDLDSVLDALQPDTVALESSSSETQDDFLEGFTDPFSDENNMM